MKIMLFGATGFIGKDLQAALKARGHIALIRDVRRGEAWITELAEVDGVVNLAGAPIFGKRWNTQVKAEIFDSRIESTKRLVEAMHATHSLTGKPQVYVNASAVGYYGSDAELQFDEKSPPGSDFLAFVCREWEDMARRASVHDKIRTVITRFGIVLGSNGGALQKLLTPFKAFVGGPIGFGKQWMSWVHIDDVTSFINYALENESVEGAFNLTAPEPVRNKNFSETLAHVLHRPCLFPVPGFVLRIILGESADFLITGQKVLPHRTLESGYEFKFPLLKAALENVLSKPR